MLLVDKSLYRKGVGTRDIQLHLVDSRNMIVTDP